MSAYVVLSPFDVEDDIAPHPELVTAQRPDRAAFMKALVTLGVWPEGSYLGGSSRISLVPG